VAFLFATANNLRTVTNTMNGIVNGERKRSGRLGVIKNNNNDDDNDKDNDDHDGDANDDVFHADPLLPALGRGQQDDYFALGLVVNWPPGDGNDNDGDDVSLLKQQYQSFCDVVKTECFPHHHDQDSVMFLPLDSLHITVATLQSATKISKIEQRQQQEIIQQWKELLMCASQHDDWPTQHLQLKIVSAHITPTAGILLWEDTTDGITKIRQCLYDVLSEKRQRQQFPNDEHNSDVEFFLNNGFRIPDIVHTTFVRYRTPPPNQIRPSESHSILLQEIVGSHPIFGDSSSSSSSSSSNNGKSTVRIECTKMVNCKIYLQPPKRQVKQQPKDDIRCKNNYNSNTNKKLDDEEEEVDHPVYLVLPIGSSAGAVSSSSTTLTTSTTTLPLSSSVSSVSSSLSL
jgi:hypothetical protein